MKIITEEHIPIVGDGVNTLEIKVYYQPDTANMFISRSLLSLGVASRDHQKGGIHYDNLFRLHRDQVASARM